MATHRKSAISSQSAGGVRLRPSFQPVVGQRLEHALHVLCMVLDDGLCRPLFGFVAHPHELGELACAGVGLIDRGAGEGFRQARCSV